FLYYPITALTLLVGLAVRQTRLWAAWFALVILAFTTLYGFWECWTLGNSFGYRGMVEVLPAGAVLLAAALGRLSGRRRAVVASCAWVCMFVTLELMVGYWTCYLTGGDPAALYWRHLAGRLSIFWLLY